LPYHVHIEKGDKYAKIEVESLRVITSYNLSSKEVKRLVEIVRSRNNEIMEAWNEYFN